MKQSSGKCLFMRLHYFVHYFAIIFIVDLSVSIHNFVEQNLTARDLPNNTVSIMLPPAIFNETMGTDISIVFSEFNSSELYPLFNKSSEEFDVASTVVSATIVGSEDIVLPVEVTIVLRLHIAVRY